MRARGHRPAARVAAYIRPQTRAAALSNGRTSKVASTSQARLGRESRIVYTYPLCGHAAVRGGPNMLDVSQPRRSAVLFTVVGCRDAQQAARQVGEEAAVEGHVGCASPPSSRTSPSCFTVCRQRWGPASNSHQIIGPPAVDLTRPEPGLSSRVPPGWSLVSVRPGPMARSQHPARRPTPEQG